MFLNFEQDIFTHAHKLLISYSIQVRKNEFRIFWVLYNKNFGIIVLNPKLHPTLKLHFTWKEIRIEIF